MFDVSRSHTSDQLLTEAATYTDHNKHKGRTFVPRAGLEPQPQQSSGRRPSAETAQPPGLAVLTDERQI
jgi:hypothetical protein